MKKSLAVSFYSLKHLGIMLMACAGFLLGLNSNAQTTAKETGIPIQKEFLPADYKASGQNFAVTTDKRGVLYFANFSGVLEYDGTTWRTILTKERTKVNTLVTDSAGRIYVGTRGEVGYLQPNKLGDMQFVSLNSYLKPFDITFPDVISSYATPQGIYFITANSIILWNGKKMKVQSIGSPLINAFYVNSKLYIQLKLEGLKCFANGRFYNVPGGGQFSEQVTVNAMVSAGKGRVLIGSGNQGLYLLTDAGIQPLKSEANTYLSNSIVSCAAALKDGSFAFGTVNGGVVVVSADGFLKEIFSKSTTGLYNNNIHYLFEDDNHGFWIATDKNISRIQTPSYLVNYNGKKNVSGNVTGITRFKSKLYITTDQGLFYYNSQQMQFTAVADLRMPCLYVLNLKNELLVAGSAGVYSYDGNQVHNIIQGYSTTLCQSKSNSQIVYAGQLKGVAVLQHNSNGQFSAKPHLPNVTDEIREIADEGNGSLWLQVPSKGIIKYNTATGEGNLYNQNHGLPYNSGNHLNRVNGKIVIGTINGAYQYDVSHNKFVRLNLFNRDTALNNTWIDQMVEGSDGTLWTTSGNGTDISSFKKTALGYERINPILAPIKDVQVLSIFPDNGSGVWLGSTDNLIFFNTRYAVSLSSIKPALIRSVAVNADSVLFSGTYYNSRNLPGYSQNKALKPVLDYHHNNISFTFSSPSSAGADGMLYNFYLEGFDTDTISWVNQQQKEYSNLPSGTYTFHVKAKNVFGLQSREATYTFIITKPFYQTIWAYLIYGFILVAIIFVVVRFRSRKLLKEKMRLEELIKDRTAEVVVQKEAIERQSLELSGKNDELEKINLIVKSINAEVHFNSLMQAILEKAKVIRGAEKAAMLVYDKPTDSFKFKASYGYNIEVLNSIQLSPDDAQTRYLSGAEEVYEDIYLIRSVKSIKNDEQLSSVNKAKSSLMMLIRVNHQIHAFMIIENWQKRNAFEERDFSLLKNLKEHFVAAVIKTTLLEDIQDTLTNLKSTQEQLIRQEKLASIGQLTKGIVDRILNPLNYINNFSMLSANLIDESLEVIEKPEISADDKEEVEDILTTVKGNMQKVHEHGSSASRIVKGMERILREKSTDYIPTDVNKLLETSLKQAILEGKKEFPGVDVAIDMNLSSNNVLIPVLPHEMNTVLNNLLMNAYYAVAEKQKQQPQHQPQIKLATAIDEEALVISIRDNGKGILAAERKQLFSPFFTTKPTAKGTGLGLYLSQDIVREHNGTINVKTEEGKYTEFIIRIPKTREITLSN